MKISRRMARASLMTTSALAMAGVALACLLTAPAAQADTIITKSPDLGPFWFPLQTKPSFVYADSFVAPTSGTVSSIGIWFNDYQGDTSAQPIVFEVVGTASGPGGGPDTTDVLATTGVVTLDVTGPLSLYSATTTSSLDLVAGDTYWVAASEVGLTGGGALQVGAHTQNTGGIMDNGTFWYSNDPAGISFSGPNLPEMAFTVTVQGSTPVPEPSTWALMLVGFAGLGFVSYRGRRKGAALPA